MTKKVSTITVEDARLIFRNFAGKATDYNQAGDRNFHVVLEPDFARQLEADGWTVKWPKPRPDIEPDEDERLPSLPVKIKYRGRLGQELTPPLVYMITNGRATRLGEGEIDLLDSADIATVDLKIRPHFWDHRGEQGISAYVEAMYVTVVLDDLAQKYQNVIFHTDEEPQA